MRANNPRQPFRKGHIAFAAENDMRVLEPGVGEPEVIKAVIEPFSGDGDAQIGHVGEIRQAHPARLMDLPVLVRAMQRPPGTDAPLQGAARTGGQIRMASLVDPLRGSTVENRHRP